MRYADFMYIIEAWMWKNRMQGERGIEAFFFVWLAVRGLP